jgi:P-type Ca2+ transporter type 2C
MPAGLRNRELTPSASSEQSATQPAGLSDQEAQQRLRAQGFNELPSARPRTMLHTALEVLREPMFLLLIGAGAVYVLLGDPLEALALLVALSIIIVITIYQERKTENALQALRDLSSPRALVIRDGVRKRIPGREVVEGDLVVLSEGDRVPADAVVLENRNLEVDESLLTGESVPVRKRAASGRIAMGRAGGDDLPFVFSGSLVVRGRGLAEVKATGVRSELGKIGKSLQSLGPESTRLQQETARLVRVFAVLGIGLCVAVAFIYGYTRANWLQGALAGLTLAISMVPEEFPVVLTIFLAMGAWRISRKRVLTRRMPAIETLGSATVLCVDKTGTLTQNRMTVQRLFAGGDFLDVGEDKHDIPDKFHPVIEYSMLASSRDPFDPMEKAFRELGNNTLPATEHLHRQWKLIREYPLSQDLLAMSRVWEVPGEGYHVVAAKGAPEAISELCSLSPENRNAVKAATGQMAAQGLRVLAVAGGKISSATDLPEDQRKLRLELIGLIGLADPVRPSVPAAVEECYRAGVRVIMITGDYPVTAQNIAAQIGLRERSEVITGAQLESMDDAELRERLGTVSIFARVAPEQKLRLVKALKARGEIVAMTGDGVNDAPALKAADIGIAMGARGTDVAREAASLVLMDDDFSSIVNAIRLGRRIYDNLKKATAYILAIHVPIAGITLIPVLLKWPLVLMPLHVLFLELIIDPTCSIAFEAEPEEYNVMNRPPRRPEEKLFSRRRVGVSLLQGLTVLVTVLLVYGIAWSRGHDEMDSRALAFSTLIVGNLCLIFTNRSWSRTIWQMLRSPNRALWWVTASALAILAAILYVPLFRNLFRFSFLHPADVLIAGLAGFLGVLWFELFKLGGKWLRTPQRAARELP